MSFSPAHPCLTQVQFSAGTFEALAMAGGQAPRGPLGLALLCGHCSGQLFAHRLGATLP